MNKLLLYNFNELKSSWDFVPRFIWEDLVNFCSRFNCEFGFRYLVSEDDISKFSFFDSLELERTQIGFYQPTNIPADITNPKEYTEKILLFKIDDTVFEKLRDLELDTLCVFSENPTEEVVIFKDSIPFLIGTNIDSHVCFPNAIKDDLDLLFEEYSYLREHIYDSSGF